ncbi:uncharacterized protein H6S33_002393, partial [Morchella sextelata]|uniref:uncharacterized protein n=1 Tax=Morchella sextelata TaxID=1174677 RepID=UPI001D05A208
YGDINTRTIIGDYLSQTIPDLDSRAGITWKSTLEPLVQGASGDYWTFKSEVTSVSDSTGGDYEQGPAMSIHIYKKPFRFQASRSLKPLDELWPLPVEVIQSTPRLKTVWQTSEQTFRYKLDPDHDMVKNVILDVIKPGHGEYIGWGEQGGSSFMKKPTLMNYFNCDNMQYQQVYNEGPLDPREPLYHSDPFFLDINSNPEHKNVTATFIDNYSQICVDFGKSNAGYIKIATKFGSLDVICFSGDSPRDIVRLYTALIGRSALKPRYILGNHQSCYGYMNKQQLFDVVKYYRDRKIPLDGLHIDVPLQNNFRTFTVDRKAFSEPEQMFAQLRSDGIKCCTNITPVISANDLPGEEGYKTLRSGRDKGYFIKDKRYTKGVSEKVSEINYMCYEGGSRNDIPADEWKKRPTFTTDDGRVYRDEYEHYNKGGPYRGGVSYGYNDGTPGHYADLNNEDVREWWGQQYEDLFAMGLEFVWQDMTTPAIHESFGDMKGLPSRLMLDFPNHTPSTKLAIEAWAVYSYNLHKATFQGLSKLKGRENKRNFILGRGSYAGMYRYAGLWTGDNASTWDFWRITVSQVLSVGLNGVSICGADTGGFEPARIPGDPERGIEEREEKICNPELLIRWYVGSTFLPWLRNHYVSRKDTKTGEMRKWFQEPYAYPIHWEDYRNNNRTELVGQAWLYYGVQFIVQYYIQLRYSLIQLLYDAMFENQIHGLPIARSMFLTDPQDTTFFNESQKFLDDQYVVGQDILVAPIMHSRNEKGHHDESREVYFPLGYFWFPSNLRPFSSQRVPLVPSIPGGKVLYMTAQIPVYNDPAAGTTPQPEEKGYPDVLLHFIREGSIIPQCEVRQHLSDGKVNPITLNIYPHVFTHRKKRSEYTTYLDDGVSCSSAPEDTMRVEQLIKAAKRRGQDVSALENAKYDEYRAVNITHETTSSSTRTVTICRKVKDVDYDPKKEIGEEYTVIFWYEKRLYNPDFEMTVTPSSGVTVEKSDDVAQSTLHAVILKVKETLGNTEKVAIKIVMKEN